VGGLAAAVVIAAAVAAPRAARGDDAPMRTRLNPGQCFRSTDVKNWAAPDPHTLYLRVLANRYYRVDLARDCNPLRWRTAFLQTNTMGGNAMICSPLDYSIRASDWPGDPLQTCFVSKITPLTHEEAAALPRNAKP
jgi:hypothetical protein